MVPNDGSGRGFGTRVRDEGSGALALLVLREASMVHSFRELVSWQLANELKEKTFELLQRDAVARDFKFRDQLLDSARSVPRNIAEGFGRFSPAEFCRFYDIARGSLDETEVSLRDGVASNYFPPESVGPRILLAARCRKAINRHHSYLRSAKTDPRFRPQREGR